MADNDKVIFAASPMAECEFVREVLDEYFGHGLDAPAKFPLIFAHLRNCRWCQSDFEALEEAVRRLGPEWESLSRTLTEEAQVVARKPEARTTAINWLAPVWNSQRMAITKLGTSPPAGTFSSEIDVDDPQGKLSVRISPFLPDGWQVKIEQLDAKADRLVVGLGSASGAALNTKVVRYGRAAEFFISGQDYLNLCLHVGNRRVKFPAPGTR